MPTSIDPSTGATLAEYPFHDADETERRVALVHAGQHEWRARPIAERAALLRSLGAQLRTEREAHAELMVAEMGKPLAQALGEIDKCAWLCEWYADHGPAMLADEPVETDALRSFISYQPLGVILAIMPWNFPWWQALRFAVPALLAGNTVLLKHAPNTTGCGLAIVEAARKAGLPSAVFETLILDNDAIATVIEDPRIAGVSLTGSTRAGRAVGEVAGRSLKKLVLELGGSDPYVVLADADVEHAAEVCVRARLHNSGQTCVAAKRFIVVEAVADRFEAAVVERMKQAVLGPPRAATTTVGPLARLDLRAALHDQVGRSIAAGATLALGGELPEGPGAFYPPTLLTGVEPGMPAAEEELFGPVAAVMRVQTDESALVLANRTAYGLGAVVFTRDLERGERIAREQLEAGCCFVNAQVKSDPRLPFGGIKDSGVGRELGRAGLMEWVNVKTVWVERG